MPDPALLGRCPQSHLCLEVSACARGYPGGGASRLTALATLASHRFASHRFSMMSERRRRAIPVAPAVRGCPTVDVLPGHPGPKGRKCVAPRYARGWRHEEMRPEGPAHLMESESFSAAPSALSWEMARNPGLTAGPTHCRPFGPDRRGSRSLDGLLGARLGNGAQSRPYEAVQRSMFCPATQARRDGSG